MAVEITETPRHTLTVSEQNWQLKLSTVGVADLPDNATFNDLTVSNLLTANHIHGNIAGQLYVHVRIDESGGVVKGDPVYVSGFHDGDHSQPIVSKAQANDSNKMPALGIMDGTYANNYTGANCVISGLIEDVNTNGFGINSPIYVGPTGGFTATKPSTNPQQVGICSRDNQNNGSFVVTAQSVKPNQDLNTDSDVEFASLDVSGNLNLGGDIGGLSTGLTFGDGDTGIWESSDDNLRLSTGSSTRVIITSSGDVKIGNQIPVAKLDVESTESVIAKFDSDVSALPCSVTINYSGDAGLYGGSFLTLSHDDGSNSNSAYDRMGGFYIAGRTATGYVSNAAGLEFYATNNWTGSITATTWNLYSSYIGSNVPQTFSFNGNNGNYYFNTVGNVGIGNQAPAQKLDVSGAVKKAVYTVSTLPTPSIGASCYVSDANTTHAAGVGTTVVGGGANFVPVYYNGSNWIIG